jgi:predicted PurR-regulated permease PerM
MFIFASAGNISGAAGMDDSLRGRCFMFVTILAPHQSPRTARAAAGTARPGFTGVCYDRARTPSPSADPDRQMPNARLQALVYGAALALIIGWVLYIGRDVFVPVVLGVLVVYVIVGLTRLLGRLPYVGRRLPDKLAYALSMLLIGAGFATAVSLAIGNMDGVIARGPLYQESLLASIQQLAVWLGVETEPTWISLRQDLLAQINLQRVIGSTVVSVTSILVSFVVVVLYASFLLLELRHFPAKLAGLSDDPQRVARIRQVTHDINARIGSYLALKTVLSLLLGAICWVIMTLMGLEFALFWAVLIALLNFVPYIGSFLGVALPVAMAIVQFADLNTAVMLTIYLSIVQFAIGNFLDPYMMGNSLNLSPFAILVSLTIWSGLWGIPGAFLAVPITSILTIVLSGFPGTRPVAVLLSRDGRV